MAHLLKTPIALSLAAGLLGGCVTQPTSLYQWGSYQNQIYASYSDPGKVPLEKQIENLEEDYQKARSGQHALPPGFHAHLGHLYFQVGKSAQALQSFKTEKSLFPESSVFMDAAIQKMEAQ